MERKRLLELVAGDIEPICGNKIKELVIKSDTFIVYLDENDGIYWATDGHEENISDYGLVMNRVRELESLNERILKGKELNTYNYLVAEEIARLFDDSKPDNAITVLNEAERKIKIYGNNKNRLLYIISSLSFTLTISLFIFLIFAFRNSIITNLNRSAYEIIITSLFGGLGAFISVFFRSNNYEPDISLGRSVHILDGVLRNFYGCIAGLFIILGIKSNIIMGFLNKNQESLILFCFIALVAGASESLIPSLIKQVEGKSSE